MLARIRKAQENEGGFTLIELLVVIIIIGILAAIAIPTFLNQREKGWKSQVRADVKNAATAMESYATDNNGSYTSALADLQAEGFNPTPDVTVTPTDNGDGTYTLSGSHGLTTCVIVFSSATGQTDDSGC